MGHVHGLRLVSAVTFLILAACSSSDSGGDDRGRPINQGGCDVRGPGPSPTPTPAPSDSCPVSGLPLLGAPLCDIAGPVLGTLLPGSGPSPTPSPTPRPCPSSSPTPTPTSGPSPTPTAPPAGQGSDRDHLALLRAGSFLALAAGVFESEFLLEVEDRTRDCDIGGRLIFERINGTTRVTAEACEDDGRFVDGVVTGFESNEERRVSRQPRSGRTFFELAEGDEEERSANGGAGSVVSTRVDDTTRRIVIQEVAVYSDGPRLEPVDGRIERNLDFMIFGESNTTRWEGGGNMVFDIAFTGVRCINGSYQIQTQPSIETNGTFALLVSGGTFSVQRDSGPSGTVRYESESQAVVTIGNDARRFDVIQGLGQGLGGRSQNRSATV
jgi:hypothetical protein